MAAEFTVAIWCDPNNGTDCLVKTPAVPGTARASRKVAVDHGWEVVKGNHGRDVCPPCRIREIREQVRAASKGAASGDEFAVKASVKASDVR